MSMSAPHNATPERIVDIATGYMAAKQLFIAARIGLFAALATGGRTARELSTKTGRGEPIVRILADAMNAVGLLERHEGRYFLAADAEEYLSGSGRADLTPFLAFLNDVSYPHWLAFDTTVDTGSPAHLERDERVQATMSNGVGCYFALHAAMLASAIDFGAFSSALDLGALSPEFVIRALGANPLLRARTVVASSLEQRFRDALVMAGCAERAVVEAAEPDLAAIGVQHDLVMVNHVIHRFGAEQNRAILRTARTGASQDATLIILDFLLDDDHQQRRVDALHAGEYAVIDGTVVHSAQHVRGWLRETGWLPLEVRDLPGGPRVVIARAVADVGG
jgi:hypothetical protein